MTRKTAPVRGVATMAAALAGFALPALAQENTGIASPLISRCAGKFGSTLRQGDQAFPLFSLDGTPWVKIEHADKTVAGVAIADTVTGTGMRLRTEVKRSIAEFCGERTSNFKLMILRSPPLRARTGKGAALLRSEPAPD